MKCSTARLVWTIDEGYQEMWQIASDSWEVCNEEFSFMTCVYEKYDSLYIIKSDSCISKDFDSYSHVASLYEKKQHA